MSNAKWKILRNKSKKHLMKKKKGTECKIKTIEE